MNMNNECTKCNGNPCDKKSKAFPSAVIEIDNPPVITNIRKVVVPASMGDDTTVPPVVGKYHNVLLYYEANSKSYLYSSDGIPTQLNNGITNYEDAINLPQINGVTLRGNKTSEELGLQGEIANIEQYARFFDTVADMKASTDLVAGDYARTGGFYALNDGGGALYKITDTGTANEMDVISVGDLYAEIILPEVASPEMFGAYGDGSHDDTNAWNKAVSVGRNVKAFEKTYLVSTIEVTNDIDIDCGNASFVCSGTRLFNIHGESTSTLANESNYTANDVNYSITNAQYTTYTGFAFLRGDNNFEESRDYYRGGFACTFDNGKICTPYPIPVTNTTIDIINPIHGSLKNIKNITHQTITTANRSILIEYAEGYVIENIYGKDLKAYVDIDISKSINVTCRNLNITHDISFTDNTSYIVYIEDSSFCNLTDSYLYNKKWHSWTTSGIYLCYKNTVANSTLFCDSQYAICDHANALGTTVENVNASLIDVCGLSYVNNVKIYPLKDTQKRCHVAIQCPSIENNAKYTITNVYLNTTTGANGTYCGIWFSHAPVVTGKTYTYADVYIENIKTNKTINCRTYFNLLATSNYVIKNITIKNAWLDINLPTTSQSHIDVSNSDIYLEGITEYIGTRRCDVGLNGAHCNKLTITNSYLRQIYCTVTTLVLSNINLTQDSNNLVATNIYGSNLQFRIPHSVISGATIVNIANMQFNPTTQQFNFVKANGTVYYQQVNTTTGLFETKTLA